MSDVAVNVRKRLDRVSLIWLTRGLWLFSRVVPYRLGVLVGGLLGFVAYAVLRRERNRTLTNLAETFPDRDRKWVRRTARRCFIHLGKALLEVMLMTPARLARVVDIAGAEKIERARAAGKGVVYVTGHIGNWELMAHAVAAQWPLSVIAAPLEPEPVNDMIVALRAGLGVQTVLRGRPGASRELIRCFRENRILGILIDQDTDVESVFVPFMGRPAWTPTAAATMALRFGAPIVFGYIRRTAKGRHAIVIEGPLELVKTGDPEKDITANTARLTAMIEACIREEPEQWVWMHRRWRRQP